MKSTVLADAVITDDEGERSASSVEWNAPSKAESTAIQYPQAAVTSTLAADPASSAPSEERASSGRAAPVRDPGRYALLGEHGRGGLGRVSRAHDKDLGRDIAIKELLSRGRVNDLRFAREAMITARLEHPGIVPVYEAGQWPDGTPFYAMKLVSGRPLRDLIAERTTIDERVELLHHVIAVADAMSYAHRRGIIHRDLKPANVIVGEFGETVVIDWGLAKDLSVAGELPRGDGPVGPTEESLTSMGSVLGTPAYMAPEQERGEQVDQRADVFAIGAMLWELCSLHKVPPTETSLRHRMLRRAGIDPDLVTIIDKALDPEAARRYADAGALASDLKAFKAGARIASRSYSVWAVLAHWTRRHRTIALSVTAVVVFGVAGAIAFVRNIATARDRADAALVDARGERDRSKLSEASLVLDKDPNRALELLASLATHTPQVALITSRARHLSPNRVVNITSKLRRMSRVRGAATIELLTHTAELQRLDPVTGAVVLLDTKVTPALGYHHEEMLYIRQDDVLHDRSRPGSSSALVVDTGKVGGATQLLMLDKVIYVVDRSGDLYRVSGDTSTVVDHGIHRIAGSGNLLLVCRSNGALEVQRQGVIVLRRRCPQTKSADSMMVIGEDYVALTADGTLLVSRGGKMLEIATGTQGEYELALSDRGIVGISDYRGAGKTWFVRPGSSRLEPGPFHSSQPFSVAADGDLVAWGYADGEVIARNLLTGMSWQFPGNAVPAAHLVVDAVNGRIVSAGGREVRIWNIEAAPIRLIATMPCSIFHVELSRDANHAGLDCNDGSVSVWSRQTGTVTKVHEHVGYSSGLQWLRGMLCSGGFGDGRIRCSSLDGRTTEVPDFHAGMIVSPISTRDDHSLIFGTDSGKVWRFGTALEELYAHGGIPNVMAISESGRLLASSAQDGSFVVYDLVNRQMLTRVFAHIGAFSAVSWVGEELWSVGSEGTIKRWLVHDGALALQHMVQVPGSLRLIKVLRGRWVAVVGSSMLVVSRDGESIALRIDLGRSIVALDYSADGRYVAVSVSGEIIVLDLQTNALSTVATGSPVQQLSFLAPTLIAFSEPAALKTLQVDQLNYIPFLLAPASRSPVTF